MTNEIVPTRSWLHSVAPELWRIPRPCSSRHMHLVCTPLAYQAIPAFVQYVCGVTWTDHLALVATVLISQRYEEHAAQELTLMLHVGFNVLFREFGIETMEEWDAESCLTASYSAMVASELEQFRTSFWFRYATATKQEHHWFDSLSDLDRRTYQQYVLPAVSHAMVMKVWRAARERRSSADVVGGQSGTQEGHSSSD